MNGTGTNVVTTLVDDYIATHPVDAATQLERLGLEALTEFLESAPMSVASKLLPRLRPDIVSAAMADMDERRASHLATSMDPGRSAAILARLAPEKRQNILHHVAPNVTAEIEELMAYPADSAGRLMDASFHTFRPSASAAQTLARLRAHRERPVQYVYVVDADSRLVGAIPLQDVAVADPNEHLEQLISGPPVTVGATASQSEVVEILDSHRITALPVVDVEGRIVGVIRYAALFRAAEDEAMVDLQTMVGVSKEERALSPALFAVRKRLPWLNVNLVTAFLAAAVVGIFEGTIARFTALAVLLPVVAGQSGNTGAQALAVTMRGLALREIRARHWIRIALKEMTVGAINGIVIAIVTGAGVWVWSRSVGLAGVIAVAMVISMSVASLSGASVPIVLTLLKQDPAQSSSIILTTVTDIMGFLSFLGLATLAASLI